MKLSVPVVLMLATLVGIASAYASSSELAEKKESPRGKQTHAGGHGLRQRQRYLADEKKVVVSDGGREETTGKKMRKMKKMKKMKKSASVRFAEVGEGQKLTGEKAAKVPKAKKGKNGGDDSGGLGTRVAGTSSRIENRGFNEGGKASFKWDKDATGDCDWRADVTACANVGGQVALTRDALELYECESDSDCEDNCCFGGGTVFGWNAITQAEQRACFSVNAMAGASTGCMQYNSVSQIPTDDSNSLK
eukprot:CAMPEP_0113588988 /NCGR_PEP_ID=MMETSP0015_2-20120614/35836_1 /TAXON_ID=2838 /ORGANISM="Odontella" /LENGTH=248 /DNA_ID=CAMNT_0000494953 /DNA_START=44 /DNA_END=790 /DNA_ORIENTATION=- /assembly_acc=CAM_ASM_000160